MARLPHGAPLQAMSERRTRGCQQRRVAPGAARRGLRLGRSALCADCAAMLGPGSRRETRFVHFVHCARTVATSQITKRAARADPGPALLAAPHFAPGGQRLARGSACGTRSSACHRRFSKGGSGQAGARLGGAEHRSARGGARSALRDLTRRSCPNAVSEANEVSSAPCRGREKRRAVGAQRRPPPWSVPACPDPPLPRERTACASAAIARSGLRRPAAAQPANSKARTPPRRGSHQGLAVTAFSLRACGGSRGR